MSQTVIGSDVKLIAILNLEKASKQELERKLKSSAYRKYAKTLIRQELVRRAEVIRVKQDKLKIKTN